MSLSMADVLRFQALELRVAEIERRLAGRSWDYSDCEVVTDGEGMKHLKRRGRPPKNLEERMKAQEHDPINE